MDQVKRLTEVKIINKKNLIRNVEMKMSLERSRQRQEELFKMYINL